MDKRAGNWSNFCTSLPSLTMKMWWPPGEIGSEPEKPLERDIYPASCGRRKTKSLPLGES